MIRRELSAPARPNARRRRAMWALAGSLLFHAGILVAMFGPASGDIVSGAAGGGFQGPVMEVSLVGPPATSAAAAEVEAQSAALQPLFAKFRVGTAEEAVHFAPGEQPSEFASLAKRLQSREPPTPKTTPVDRFGKMAEARAPREVAEESSALTSQGRAADLPRPGPAATGSGAAGGLWGQIEPCWRDIAGATRGAIVLEVSLDQQGRLSAPPRILRRPEADSDQQRLRAEAMALAALSACLPRNDLRFAGKVHRLEFRPRS